LIVFESFVIESQLIFKIILCFNVIVVYKGLFEDVCDGGLGSILLRVRINFVEGQGQLCWGSESILLWRWLHWRSGSIMLRVNCDVEMDQLCSDSMSILLKAKFNNIEDHGQLW